MTRIKPCLRSSINRRNPLRSVNFKPKKLRTGKTGGVVGFGEGTFAVHMASQNIIQIYFQSSLIFLALSNLDNFVNLGDCGAIPFTPLSNSIGLTVFLFFKYKMNFPESLYVSIRSISA